MGEGECVEESKYLRLITALKLGGSTQAQMLGNQSLEGKKWLNKPKFMCAYIYFLALSAKETITPVANDTPTTVSTPNTGILVSKSIQY